MIGKKIEESIGSKITGLYKEYYWSVRNGSLIIGIIGNFHPKKGN